MNVENSMIEILLETVIVWGKWENKEAKKVWERRDEENSVKGTWGGCADPHRKTRDRSQLWNFDALISATWLATPLINTNKLIN